MSSNKLIGLGDSEFIIAFYVETRPALEPYYSLSHLQPLQQGDIKQIAEQCGNGWRKVFNVYAKFLFALPEQRFHFVSLTQSWQDYREHYLCQPGSGCALLFCPPQLPLSESATSKQRDSIHIIAGRSYAKKLMKQGKLQANLLWLNEQFAVDLSQRLIISPYLDYRQLSNQKISTLVKITCALTAGLLPELD